MTASQGWWIGPRSTALLLAVMFSAATLAQTTEPPSSTPQSSPTSTGTILFERHTPATPEDPIPPPSTPSQDATARRLDDTLAVTDAEREALIFLAYDLDVHLSPASSGIAVRAGVTVRNDSPQPLTRVVLQISSSLHWDAISTGTQRLPFTPHQVATDADHTGFMQEAVVPLAQPLAPGASLRFTALYSGAIPPSAERLERIGAPAEQAIESDWDAVSASVSPASSPASSSSSSSSSTAAAEDDAADVRNVGTALRGFGNVLWYPVSAAPAFLGDGAKLFDAIGRARLRSQAATVSLRLAVEYTGDPPVAAFFCGHREPLVAISDNPDVPVAESPGIATAVFAGRPLGFRTLNLFVAGHPATPAGPADDETLLAAVTDHYDALPAYTAAAAKVQPMLREWFGPQPRSSLTLLDHPGQPFEDDALLVGPLLSGSDSDSPALTASLAHSLTHAWIRSSRPWIDEGLAQFATLLWTERSMGQPAALAQLQQITAALALVEPSSPGAPASSVPSPDPTSSPAQEAVVPVTEPDTPQGRGQSLIAATDELHYRAKAAAVWWMLRTITGDLPLQQALRAYAEDTALDRTPAGFQQALERSSHKDLRWFFNDWVYRDRGLPDLTIVQVTPRPLEARDGPAAGWLVAIDVRNDGDAVAEVPVTVRSLTGRGAASETQRLRIPGRSSVSVRIVFAGTPDEVQVNDGGVPESRADIHTRRLNLPAR